MKQPYFLVHLAKDLRIEWRSRDAINSMLFFALLVVVIFSLAFDPTRSFARQIASPVLCVAILFAAVSALNQTWARELRHNVLDAHRMSPAPAGAQDANAAGRPLGQWHRYLTSSPRPPAPAARIGQPARLER